MTEVSFDLEKLLILISFVFFSYLTGSIPIGYLIGKSKGIDLTKCGSGSTGATNVLRNVGKIPALITLFGDILKGFLPVFLALKFTSCDLVAVFSGMFSIVGHSKSIFLKFKGGKSSATGLGILIALNYKIALIVFLIWLIVVFSTRYSSLGSIVAVPLVPVFFYFFGESFLYILYGIFIAIYIVLIRHRENIKRLINGTEPKIGNKK